MISGSVTSRNVCQGVAPRSWAASSSDLSNPISRDLTVITTNDRLNITCAIRIVAKPSCGVPQLRNSESSEAPSTTSGVASGMKMKKFDRRAAAELVAHERERDQRAEDGRDRASRARRSRASSSARR